VRKPNRIRHWSLSRRLVADRAVRVAVESASEHALAPVSRDALELACCLHRVGVAPRLDGLADALARWAAPGRRPMRPFDRPPGDGPG